MADIVVPMEFLFAVDSLPNEVRLRELCCCFANLGNKTFDMEGGSAALERPRANMMSKRKYWFAMARFHFPVAPRCHDFLKGLVP